MWNENGGLDSVPLLVDELLEKVKANRAKHNAIFREALDGYKERALELLQDHINRIEAGKVEKVQVILPQPVDHTKDYDRVIGLLEMTKRAGTEKLDLNQREFAQYVQDEWDWKDEFISTNVMYAASLQNERD